MFSFKNKPEFKFNLGDKVKDKITEFEGIIIARHQWLNGCNTYSLQPTQLKDGVPQERHAFDEPQLIIVVEKLFEENRKTGGPEKKVNQPNR